MKFLVKTLFVVLATISVAHAAGDAGAGKAKAAACGACHGADGNSVVGTFPKLAGQGEKYLLKQMKDIRGGARMIPAMAGQVDNMSDQDLADIAAYYAGLSQSPSASKDENLALGEQIYRAGNAEVGITACTACHSPRGLGNAPAGFPRIAGQHAEYIATQLKAFQTEARTNDGDSKIMRGVVARMSDKEIAAVANYVAGLR
jgi:cytochrome c553